MVTFYMHYGVNAVKVYDSATSAVPLAPLFLVGSISRAWTPFSWNLLRLQSPRTTSSAISLQSRVIRTRCSNEHNLNGCVAMNFLSERFEGIRAEQVSYAAVAANISATPVLVIITKESEKRNVRAAIIPSRFAIFWII
jgi:hypothetical protein